MNIERYPGVILTSDVHPEMTLYYVGGRILELLLDGASGPCPVEVLAQRAHDEAGVSSENFTLGMDWLYLLGAVRLDDAGGVCLCS